jgi:hypothetical protein
MEGTGPVPGVGVPVGTEAAVANMPVVVHQDANGTEDGVSVASNDTDADLPELVEGGAPPVPVLEPVEGGGSSVLIHGKVYTICQLFALDKKLVREFFGMDVNHDDGDIPNQELGNHGSDPWDKVFGNNDDD